MKWKKPQHHEIRTIRKFLIFPLTIKSETRWLEFVYIRQWYDDYYFRAWRNDYFVNN
ncbi:hypothetical protein CLK_A0105 (plasmid) [Clostridium botulinum A3 str. Loch Maree]|nr:hypothetical protein CLK_A0105 [Clostridium botulinum A3 str. Loch Maree]